MADREPRGPPVAGREPHRSVTDAGAVSAAVPSRRMARILLVRHGESEWNALGRWQGQADSPLSDLGRQQAKAASRALGSLDAVASLGPPAGPGDRRDPGLRAGRRPGHRRPGPPRA